MRSGRSWARVAVCAVMAAALAGCGGDGGDGGEESGGEAQASLTERIESSEDCDELATIRSEQQAMAEEAEGTSAHTGFAIAARARMTAIGCEVEE